MPRLERVGANACPITLLSEYNRVKDMLLQRLDRTCEDKDK